MTRFWLAKTVFRPAGRLYRKTMISYVNMSFSKFCGPRRSTVFNHNRFSPMRFCSKCGAALDDKRKTIDDRLE